MKDKAVSVSLVVIVASVAGLAGCGGFVSSAAIVAAETACANNGGLSSVRSQLAFGQSDSFEAVCAGGNFVYGYAK